MTSTIAKVVRKKDHRDRYIGSLFRTSEPVTMIPDGFLNPSVDYQLLLFTEVINLITLVFDCLFVAITRI